MSTAPDDQPMQSNPVPVEATHSDAGRDDGRRADPGHRTAPDRTPPDHSAPDHSAMGHADALADAMKDQLRKDVASWREGRSEGSTREATELSVAVARTIVPPTNARMKRAKPAVVEAKPNTTGKKPFGMSYDGTSRADYIKLMISRGAR